MTSLQKNGIDLTAHPLWRPEDLGKAIPDSAHAISVCLPTWADTIAYEEEDPRVLSRLEAGYPRFFFHPLVREIFSRCEERLAGPGELCLVYPSRDAAERCRAFLGVHAAGPGRLRAMEPEGLWAVLFPEESLTAAKAIWRHAGEGISSRRAKAVLEGRTEPDAVAAKETIRRRLADAYAVGQEQVFLFPTGMSAIFSVLRAGQRLHPNRESVEFGFPYVDVLKLQQKIGAGVLFYPRGNEADRVHLENRLEKQAVSAIFCEFPTNPLLTSPDLKSLAELAERRRFPLIVDDTIGTTENIRVLPWADVAVTSLTKFFSGSGNVMGGSAIVNPESAFAPGLTEIMTEEYEDLLWGEDALLLAHNSQDLDARMRAINRTAERLCDFLQRHPLVDRVYYPKYSTPDLYAACMRPGGGFGGLFSILLADAPERAPRFFDALRVSKGPNLGTVFSLSCAYTLLAHYQELDFAERCGVPRHLVRVSVGLEEPDDLIDRFDRALTGL